MLDDDAVYSNVDDMHEQVIVTSDNQAYGKNLEIRDRTDPQSCNATNTAVVDSDLEHDLLDSNVDDVQEQVIVTSDNQAYGKSLEQRDRTDPQRCNATNTAVVDGDLEHEVCAR